MTRGPAKPRQKPRPARTAEQLLDWLRQHGSPRTRQWAARLVVGSELERGKPAK